MKGASLSPASILRRVAYPVEPFRLELVPREFSPPLLKGQRDRLWQRPDLLGQVNDGQADQFKCIHNSGVGSTRSIF